MNDIIMFLYGNNIRTLLKDKYPLQTNGFPISAQNTGKLSLPFIAGLISWQAMRGTLTVTLTLASEHPPAPREYRWHGRACVSLDSPPF